MLLTLVAYVKEQYMSPKKKSLNSTGYNPANSKRHWGTLASFKELAGFDNLHENKQTTSDSYGKVLERAGK